MIGTITRPGNVAAKAMSAAMSAVDHMRAAGWKGRRAMRQFLCGESGRRQYRVKSAKTIRALKRCVSLSDGFKIVERDESVTRKIMVTPGDRYGHTRTVDAPLIFHTKLPAKIKTSLDFTVEGQRFSATAVTPMPTTEALAAIREHGKKFDRLELWWVPNDVLVEQIPDPDPIVVGAVDVLGNRCMYFELHRWVDESVEVGWWSKEGY